MLTGSTKLASSGSTPWGTGIVPRSTIQSKALTYWAKPPPEGSKPAVVPLRLYTSHWAYTRLSQKKHAPQGMW